MKHKLVCSVCRQPVVDLGDRKVHQNGTSSHRVSPVTVPVEQVLIGDLTFFEELAAGPLSRLRDRVNQGYVELYYAGVECSNTEGREQMRRFFKSLGLKVRVYSRIPADIDSWLLDRASIYNLT